VDLDHLRNVIQGEVLRITERRHPCEHYLELDTLERFLRDQAQEVLIEKMKAREQDG
jgi:hypothetical protein